ncbi:TauD/TfdA family dioxygenase [Cupriavidus necator]|uniref:TauD/TfdA family dioxygenase n=1 Tax=Cupriavidus necator TaxID=106590 RepID=UPI00339DA23C
MQAQRGWVAEDLKKTTQWIHYLTPEEISALDTALSEARKKGLSFETLTKENFPLNALRPTFDRTLEELEEGLGFFVVRGLPAEKYSKDDLRLMYWGIGLHVGTAVTQSSRGDMLGDVRNFGVDTYSKKGRGYMSNQHLQFHADTCDVVCLMVLRVAKSGGLSRFCSSIAIHDEIARTRPDLLEVLYQPFYMSWKGQEAPGDLPYYQQPMFSMEQGKLASRFIPQHIIGYNAEQLPELPSLSEKQREAIEYVQTLANDPRFYGEMMFEPGDMQFMNNHVMYHSRTEFEDYEDPDKRRHLIRMWLSVPNSRPLNDSMNAIYRDRRPGAVRGGFPSHTGARVFETPVITD